MRVAAHVQVAMHSVPPLAVGVSHPVCALVVAAHPVRAAIRASSSASRSAFSSPLLESRSALSASVDAYPRVLPDLLVNLYFPLPIPDFSQPTPH